MYLACFSTDYLDNYVEPNDPNNPYGGQSYGYAVDVDDDFDDEDYEGEFEDFYDYAWKTGNLHPASNYLYLVKYVSLFYAIYKYLNTTR